MIKENMNNNSRTFNAILNTYIGIFAKAISIILSFITRTIFIKYLNDEYLGLNGLFTNILAVLSLAELGFGTAMVYHMYEPIAHKDEKKLGALLCFYKRIYQRIACVIGLLGLAFIPFIKLITDNNNIKDLYLIYILFLAENTLSYLFTYKRSMIFADQREYIISRFRLLFIFVRTSLQIIMILVFKNYIGYLVIGLLSTFAENFVVSKTADKLYPFLKKNENEKLDKDYKNFIWTDVKSLVIYKAGGLAIDGTDNIIISVLSGLVSIGYLSNYNMIIGSVEALVSQFTNGIIAGVGNFIIEEDNQRKEELLYVITFINFMLYGIFFVCLYCMLNPFIQLWIGSKYVLDLKIVYILCFNRYIYGMMSSTWTYRSTMGLFRHGKYRPLFSAVINLVTSILLGRKLGILGVLLGTTITRLTTNAWYDPWIVYRHGLNKSVFRFYFKQILYFLVITLDIIFIENIFHNVSILDMNLLTLILKLTTCLLVVTISFLVFIKSQEAQYIIASIKKFVDKKTIKKLLINK